MTDEQNLTVGQMGKLLGVLAQNLASTLTSKQVQKLLIEDPSTIQRLARLLKSPHQEAPKSCMFMPKDVVATEYFYSPIFSEGVQKWWQAGVELESTPNWYNQDWLRLEYVDTKSYMSLTELRELHDSVHPRIPTADATYLLQVVATMIACQGVEDPGLLINSGGYNVFMVNTHEYGAETLVLINPHQSTFNQWHCDVFRQDDKRSVPAESRIFTFFQ